MLRYRLIFGPLMIGLAVGLFYLDSRVDHVRLTSVWQDLFGRAYPPAGLVLLGVCMVLIPLAARELSAIFAANDIRLPTWLIALAGMAACLVIYATPQSYGAPAGAVVVASVLVACFVITLVWHSRHARAQGAMAAAGAVMFAVAYLGLMTGFYLAIRRWHSPWTVLGVILIVKMGDIGAYATGRAIGRHKLIPWLSPGKTWEGLAGAVVFCVLVAMAFAWLSQHYPGLITSYRTSAEGLVPEAQQFHIGIAALAGVLLALVGHAGDLTMSLFKRDAGLKDSGRSVPGFGGLLDVLDSPLLAAPVAYWMLELAST